MQCMREGYHSIIQIQTSVVWPYSDQHTGSIALLAGTVTFARCDLSRSASIARRYVQNWVAIEEVSRTEQKCHRLCRHNRIVFGRWEVGDSECMPQDNVGVIDRAIVSSLFNPQRNALRRLTRRLRNMATSRVDLIVRVWRFIVSKTETSNSTFHLQTYTS